MKYTLENEIKEVEHKLGVAKYNLSMYESDKSLKGDMAYTHWTNIIKILEDELYLLTTNETNYKEIDKVTIEDTNIEDSEQL